MRKNLFSCHKPEIKLSSISISILICAVFTIFFSCDFIPPTGLHEYKNNRTTPQKVIEQLIRSYRLKRLDMFEDLLPRDIGVFRFYVSPPYSTIISNLPNVTYEPEIDFHYVQGKNFYYWGHQDEVSRHRMLFRNAETIKISEEQPILNYKYTIDPLNAETTHVEILWTSSEHIDITLPRTVSRVNYRVQIERQVFFLKRDHEGLWVIQYWFDLSNTPNG